jgi:hypothetical protein
MSSHGWIRMMRMELAIVILLGPAVCSASDPVTAILACRALADSAARLACFDRESARLAPAAASASASSPAATMPAPAATPPAAAPPGAPPVSDSKANFGLPESTIAQKEMDAGLRPKQLSKVEAHLTSVSVTGTGLATFALDNGQVWRQLSAEGDMLGRVGDPVTVSRGVFSSYWLQLKNGRGCKVTRVL